MALACILTVLIETPLMYLMGYRTRDHVIVVICANVATNLILNSLISIFRIYSPWMIAGLEVLVVLSEWLVFMDVFGKSRRLLLKVFLCNLASVLLGLLIMR